MNQLDQLTPLLPGVLPQSLDEFESEPFLVLTIAEPLPSWNELLALEHWGRKKFKDDLRERFLQGLRLIAIDSSTKTTWQKNFTLTCYATLAQYDRTIRERAKLRRDKKRSAEKNPNLLESSFSDRNETIPF